MTVKECYAQIGADYNGVLSRLVSEKLIKKFALKFLEDGSYGTLKNALENGNGEEAFRAGHTLKGVCMNLGLENLYKPSAELTEKLRGREVAGYEELFAQVQAEYEKTVKAIGELDRD